jgi:hypothetical protein
VHRGPDGVLDAGAAPPAEHSSVDQFVKYSAELIQGHGVLPGLIILCVVLVLAGQRECGCEQARLLASELKVCPADRAQTAAGRGGVAIPAAYAANAGSHTGSEFAHGRRTDRGEKFVPVGEVPVRGVGHYAYHPRRFTEYHGVRAACPG